MFIEYVMEYHETMINTFILFFSMALIMLFSVWSSPGHKFEYEKQDIDLSKYSIEKQEKINNVRESISLVTFLLVFYSIITITAFVILFFEYVASNIQDGCIKNIFNVIMPYENFIIVAILFVVGIINERIYKFSMKQSGYADKLKAKEKRFALYLVTLVMSVALLNKELFILIFSIFVGKFIWIDTYLGIKKEKGWLKNFFTNEIQKIKNDHIRRETIRFSAALFTSNIAHIVIQSIANKITVLSYITGICPTIIIVLWYIGPYTKNINETIAESKRKS
jgi:hypothetical protein